MKKVIPKPAIEALSKPTAPNVEMPKVKTPEVETTKENTITKDAQ